MNKRKIYSLLIVSTMIFMSAIFAQDEFPPANLQMKIMKINNIRTMVTNNCASSTYFFNAPAAITINYPAGSTIELGEHMGIWLGAKIEGESFVTTGAAYESSAAGSRGARFEFFPRFNPKDTIYAKSLFDYISTDAKKGIFFSENGLLDDNYLPKSEMDLICQYWDNVVLYGNTLEAPEVLDQHFPLNAHVIQRTFGWTYPAYKDVVFYDYYIINEGNKDWDEIYFAVYTDPHTGPEESNVSWTDDFATYITKNKTLINGDMPGGSDGTIENGAMVGYRIIDMPGDINNPDLKYTYDYWIHNEDPFTNEDTYERMSKGTIKPNMDPNVPLGSSIRSLLSVGPFESLAPGDTMKFTMAVIGGLGQEQLLINSNAAQSLKEKGYNVPMPPPPPKYNTIAGKGSITLEWKWKDEYEGINPEEFEDKSRLDDPFDFDGYRIYRSTVGPDGPWDLIAEFDKVNGYGYDTGLKYEYTDRGLINGVRYWYAMTSFDIPEVTDEYKVPSMESPIILAIKEVIPSISRNDTDTDEVFVVPNPYRTDVDYTANPGWEYPTQNRTEWYEVDRRLAFMNLPEECTITIYTINGMQVKELEHQGGSIEYWNLLNKNDHAVATGLYYFHVIESNGKEQIGKFVIVK